MLYSITNAEGHQTASIFTETGEIIVLPSTAPNFKRLLDYLFTNTEHDEQRVRFLANPALHIGTELAKVTDGRVTFNDRQVLLDGAAITGLLGQHLSDKISQGDDDWARFAKFIVKLEENTSRRAREELFEFLGKNGLTITEDGNFISYKGVDNDGRSCTAGTQTFKIDGKTFNKEKAHVKIPNEVGSTVSVKRRDVDDDYIRGCSYGLHVGSHSYANSFGRRLLTVEVNPRDVVTVPNEDANKMRVRAYKVLSINESRVQHTDTSWDETWGNRHEPVIADCDAAELEVGDTFREESLNEWSIVSEVKVHGNHLLITTEDGEQFTLHESDVVEYLEDRV